MKEIFEFLSHLKENNNREWFKERKEIFKYEDEKLKLFFTHIQMELNKTDMIEKMKVYRIYRDMRFSKDKTPFQLHRSVSYSRKTDKRRGGYYLKIQPDNNSIIAGGFFNPNSKDLYRIRKAFERNDTEIREIMEEKKCKKYFTSLTGEEVKTTPKGFDKKHRAIDLIKKKSFVVMRKMSDAEVLNKSFFNEVVTTFQTMRPFFDYMSEILTNDIDENLNMIH